jgi:phage protein D
VFNYVSVEFPLAEVPPQRVSYFNLYLDRYSHEVATVKFRDWDVRYTHIQPGEPVRCTIRGINGQREFVGYIHDIKPDISPGKQFVELTLIGASYRMKQARQKVYLNMTASQVVTEIAKLHNFYPYVESHPRVYPQIAQTGHSDLEFMTRLAKQCGYSLRLENTSLYFQPLTFDYTKYRASAAVFNMRQANDPRGSTLYSFKLMLGESVKYPDAYKSAAQVGGVNPYNNEAAIVTNAVRPEVIRQNSKAEFFDSYATNIVAPGYVEAANEAYAIDQRNRFPYRAHIEVIGTPEITPDKPIYLSGLGPDYSGYWIALTVTHKVIEEKPNVFKYTTIIDVGSDSLGVAEVWQDGKLISTPEVIQTRVITTGQKDIAISNTSALTTGTGVNNNAGFGETTNRSQPTTDASPYVWVAEGTNTSTVDLFVQDSNKTAATVARLGA